jgi:hypothetical protein
MLPSMKRKLGFTTERWPWVRAAMVLCVAVVAVCVWNPHISIAGMWDPYKAGGYYQQNKNGISLLVIGATVVGCLQSLRRNKRNPPSDG